MFTKRIPGLIFFWLRIKVWGTGLIFFGRWKLMLVKQVTQLFWSTNPIIVQNDNVPCHLITVCKTNLWYVWIRTLLKSQTNDDLLVICSIDEISTGNASLGCSKT